jgi:rubrerythrin
MADLAASTLVTPYRALFIAVRNEERAFAFWSYVSAYSPNETIREYAEKMAREELRHASILRKERRHAYHERRGAAARPSVKNLQQLKKEAAVLETKILEACNFAPTAATARDQETASVLARIGEESKFNMQALGLGESDLEGKASADFLPPLMNLDHAIAAMEAAAESYLGNAESARDEAAVSAAQQLSRSAITRLVALRHRRAQLTPVELEAEP